MGQHRAPEKLKCYQNTNNSDFELESAKIFLRKLF